MLDLLHELFGGEFPADERALELDLLDPSSTYGVYDDGQLVGCASAYRFDLTTPGSRVATAGVTSVGVRSTHRRRGLLNSLMTRQLHDLHDVMPVAALWAS